MARPADPKRRRAIVETAKERFTDRGYEGTTIGELAGELGISKAAIAYYFPTKDTFLDELVTPLLDALDEAVSSADDARDALSRYLAALVDHHDVAVWIDTDPAIRNDPTHGARLGAINDRLVSLLVGGSRRKSDRIRALAMLGGIWRPLRELPADDVVRHHDAIVDHALAG